MHEIREGWPIDSWFFDELHVHHNRRVMVGGMGSKNLAGSRTPLPTKVCSFFCVVVSLLNTCNFRVSSTLSSSSGPAS